MVISYPPFCFPTPVSKPLRRCEASFAEDSDSEREPDWEGVQFGDVLDEDVSKPFTSQAQAAPEGPRTGLVDVVYRHPTTEENWVYPTMV